MIITLYNTLNPLFLYMVYTDSLLISNDKISIHPFLPPFHSLLSPDFSWLYYFSVNIYKHIKICLVCNLMFSAKSCCMAIKDVWINTPMLYTIFFPTFPTYFCYIISIYFYSVLYFCIYNLFYNNNTQLYRYTAHYQFFGCSFPFIFCWSS